VGTCMFVSHPLTYGVSTLVLRCCVCLCARARTCLHVYASHIQVKDMVLPRLFTAGDDKVAKMWSVDSGQVT